MSELLRIIKKARGDGNYEGDQFGGASGSDGRGLPDSFAGNFLFATGIECSNPTIKAKNGRTIRRDLLEECGHYKNWKTDLALVRELGLKVLRYGLPYHLTHLGPNKYDWEFADAFMGEMRRLEITPILDLMHFGLPDWLGNFQNPELPVHFADDAEAVAQRYPWVRYYTPVNEIYVTARISARDGLWNECLKSDEAFVTAIKHTVAASILANHSIAPIASSCKAKAPNIPTKSAPSPKVTIENKLLFLSLDLLYARPFDTDVCMFLLDNGLTRDEYDWFMKGEPPDYQIMGNDYYGRNEHIVLPDGSVLESEDVLGWYQITKDYYDRYKKPVMHTETNVLEGDAPTWLWKLWINVLQMRLDGVPVIGFTWYSLIYQVDWDIQLAEKRGKVNPCGLFDLSRKPRPVAAAYRMLLEEFGQITMVPHGEILEVTERSAVESRGLGRYCKYDLPYVPFQKETKE